MYKHNISLFCWKFFLFYTSKPSDITEPTSYLVANNVRDCRPKLNLYMLLPILDMGLNLQVCIICIWSCKFHYPKL